MATRETAKWPPAGILGRHPQGATDGHRQAPRHPPTRGPGAGCAGTLFADDPSAEIWPAWRGHHRAVSVLALASMIDAYAIGKAIVDKPSVEAAIV